jgi:DNA-binding response OmpR family regulator
MPGVTAAPVLERFRLDERRVVEARRQRILLVEDDEHVRLLLVLTLELAGHEVHAASNAEDALACADLLPDLDLVVTDVCLPRGSGVELVETLRAQRDIAVLYITGHFEETTARLGLDRETPRLRKPFLPGELIAAVAAMV